ncbi:hypothetical protein [Kitasatospora griseola]|uniref:hypothetical protein n=1 Tax=Kitasatospora griseola TaxID=2064 RepID=UPI0006961179|nr:hypothetical protein [Kitasatospora griseola]
MTATPLLVPMEVKALLVNDAVRQRNFQRWAMCYQNLSTFSGPEPPAFSGTDLSWPTDRGHNGVHLHWTLPAALRHGSHDTTSGTTTFPYVPNRWLVLRHSGADPQRRTMTGWVVESDFVDPDAGTSAFLDPFAARPRPTRIGRCRPLSGWTESGASRPFLTAVAPGNLAFASYQPYVTNVFSLHDALAGVTDGEELGYLVVGWYSDPAADVLAGFPGEADFATWLAGELGWTVASGGAATASFYHGMVHGLTWSTTDQAKPMRMPEPFTPRLAVGSTAIDALTALVSRQAREHGSSVDAGLLEAFQYDLLRVLDDQDGPQLVEQRIHQAWFGEVPGGTRWEVVDAPTDDPAEAAGRRAEPVPAPSWLPALNAVQAAHDNAVQDLAHLQKQLYELWWKRSKAAKLPKYPTGLTDEQFAASLDPTSPVSLVSTVRTKLGQVEGLRAQIPWGGTQDELQASIDAYAASHGLAPGQLKRVDLRPFWMANDPVVVVSGAGSASITADPATLACRFAEQLVTGVIHDGRPIRIDDVRVGIPPLDLSGCPEPVRALVDEFVFLDPANAALVARCALGTTDPAVVAALRETMAGHASCIGVVPALQPGSWTQPWSPLWLLWQVTYYPIEFGTAQAPNWTFDGSGYTWNGAGADTADPLQLSGRSLLTPQSAFTMKSRLDQYLHSSPEADLAALEDFVTGIDDWDFLSQTLTGFSSLLTRRDASSLWLPADGTVVTDLAAPGATAVPMPGPATPQPFGSEPPSGFQALRSGQFAFLRVMIVDRFGQSVEVVNSTTADQFTPIIADGMVPHTTVLPQEPDRFVQLTPRLLQPARLDFDFVSAADDPRGLALGSDTPVCGWLLPNHLDRSISCYGPSGAALGELRVVTDHTATRVVSWSPAPGSPYETIASVTPAYPRLADVLSGVRDGGPAAFADFLSTIDATLWSIDPLGARDDQYLSILIGRPLALVRTRMALELNGPALSDPSWRLTFSPKPPDLPTYPFSVRLGESTLRRDGLIGYFDGGDYTRFHAVNSSPTPASYVHQIGPDTFPALRFDSASSVYLTMLVDPRAAVHATTDVLPVASLALPQSLVASALGAMAVSFRVGPLPTGLMESVETDRCKVVLPLPASKDGKWSWIEVNPDGSSTGYDLARADQAATLSAALPVLRVGWLQLTTNQSGRIQEHM